MDKKSNFFSFILFLFTLRNSSRALLLLRKKKMLETQLDKSEGILENVERMVIFFYLMFIRYFYVYTNIRHMN
jgi:hypothetical protein